MARSTPTIRDSTLFVHNGEQAISIVVDSMQWFAWLQMESSTTFAFHSHHGSYTARKERVGNGRGGCYWKAYRKSQGRLYRAYLGKSEDLTMAQLDAVALTLAKRVQGEAGKPQEISAVEHSPRYWMHKTSEAPLLATKLHPPQLPGLLIERVRLFVRLDGSFRQKLMLVQAPAGFGKTTLVNQWLVERSTPSAVAWISLDAGDNDSLRFWRSVMTACQPLLGQERRAAWQAMLALLTESVRSPFEPPPLRMALTRLLNELAVSSSERWLVLDDYHVISEPSIHEALTFFIDHLPTSVHVLLLSRSEPDLPLLRWRAGGVVGELHGAELRFSSEETAVFLNQALAISPSAAALSQLEKSLEGWAAGLRLLSLTLSGWQSSEAVELALISLGERAGFAKPGRAVVDQSISPHLPTGATSRAPHHDPDRPLPLRNERGLPFGATSRVPQHDPDRPLPLRNEQGLPLSETNWVVGADSPRRDLLDYFVSELLETQPAAIQYFLLQTSVLDRLCAPLCDAVTGNEGSGVQLEVVARAGLFLEAMVGPGGWYRYHALFAEAMRREASRRLGEEALKVFSLRASYWYEREAMFAEAIDAAWLAQDMERMARLIEQFNEQRFYEPYTIVHWLEQLPDAVLCEHPVLCLLFATELCFPMQVRFSLKAIPASEVLPISDAERGRVETLLQMAEEGWRRQGELSWIGAIWAHRALWSLVDQEPFSFVVSHAQQALTFLPQKGPLDRRLQMYRSSCLLFVGTDKLRLGQESEARQILLQAQEDNVPPGNRFLAIDIRLTLGKCCLIQGEFKLAQRYIRQALSGAREVDDGEVIADALLELAWLAFELRDLATAEQQTHEALEVVQRIHPPMQELHVRAAMQLALLQHERGETQAALEQLAELEARLPAEWTPRSVWLASRLYDWQERLRAATRRTTKETPNGTLIEPLSTQEERVLRLLAAGWSNQEIARELIISVNTVKYHVKHLYQKLGVSNRLQASEAARHLLTRG